jgi:cytochrome c peroxidase
MMKFTKQNMLLSSLLILAGTMCTFRERETFVLGKIPSPKDNLISPEKIAFGKMLFFDKRLSKNNEIACSNCHQPQRAFTDGLTKSIGVEGRIAMRNAPSLLNGAYFKSYMYDGEVKTLEQQALVPIQDHQEMGSSLKEVISKLSKDPKYCQLAKSIYKRELDAFVITRALSSYERSLISQNSKFDRYQAGEKDLLTSDELAGWKLFSEKLYCTKCHDAPHFSNYQVLNNGLYREYGLDKGRFRINGLENEDGAFKVPSLRNVAMTAPYMHDGSIRTLKGVILHYSKGGEDHKNKSPIIRPFQITNKEINQLEQFLKTLTDVPSNKD